MNTTIIMAYNLFINKLQIIVILLLTFLLAVIHSIGSQENPVKLLSFNRGFKNISPRSLNNLLIKDVSKEHEERTIIQNISSPLTLTTTTATGNSSKQAKTFHVQVTAIHVDKAEFPLSKLLFKLTLKLALKAAEKRLELRKVKLSLNIRSANTCSSQHAGAIAAEEYYTKKARLFIVSGCDDAIRGVSRLASIWDLPVMTGAGFGIDLNDKSIHRTLVRVAFSLKNAVKFLIKILKSFSWHKVNLIVDESDPNSFALKDSIEKHLLDSKEFQMNLNTISLDLQSLTTTNTYNNNTNDLTSPLVVLNGLNNYNNSHFLINSNKKNSLSSSSLVLNGLSGEDKWPSDATEQAVRDALKQSSLFSRVNILLIPQHYLRRFMLSVYDQNMANGMYTFINMPLLLITSSSSSTETKQASFVEQAAMPINTYNSSSLSNKPFMGPASSTLNQQQHQQSYSAQTGENVFLWRSMKSNRNVHAKQAFESLMSIYLKTPTTKAYVYFAGNLVNLANSDYATTTTTPSTTTNTSLASRKLEEPATFGNYNNKIQLNVNPYAASFYDCLQIYASIINESFDLIEQQLNKLSTESRDNNDSLAVIKRKKLIISTLHSKVANLARKRRFDNMVTGSININENGDRETDYTLDDMNPMTGKFFPVILYKGDSKEMERLGRIHWSSDDSIGATIDNVDCSLNGTCVGKPWSKFMFTLILISAPLIVLMSLILYFVYTQINLESQLVDYWWKISLKEVELIETRRKQAGDGSSIVAGTAGRESQVSTLSKAQKQSDDVTDISEKASKDGAAKADGKKLIKKSDQSDFARTSITKATTTNTSGFASTAADVCYGDIHLGIYKLAKVALKPIDKFNQSRKLMIELRTIKTISHNNLCRFTGILIEEPNMALVSEFCPKGSLREFFQNESMVIDWTFKYSIINDIMAGLLYLHSSPIEFHGRLKSSNCLVSSRFVVKLSDYGIRSLYEQIDDNCDELDLMKKKIWCAPEHMKSSTLNKVGSIKGDVYSFGLLLYEIITNKIPFCDLEKNDAFIMPLKALYNELKNRGPTLDKTGPNLDIIDMEQNKDLDSMIYLMKRSWIHDPNKRLSMQEANATIKRITRDVTSKKLLENLTSRMEQYTNNLESLVEAKLETLVDEKSKTEELLYQFVPKSIASLLKEGQSVAPEAFNCVTVFFSDIVGFTSLSSESSPMEVIDFLSDLYLCFDETLEHYDIFKVDTIGDAYIVASGLPERNEGKHVIEIARAALELRERISTFKIPHRPGRSLQMRVGINSGPCIAGIVGGVNMPKYCVFGDTLTTGKFMESSGLPMKIHLTEESKLLLDQIGGFNIESRTPKITKDGLPLQSFWLESEISR